MESFIQRGSMPLGFQRRLSRLYNDTKKSSDFVQEPVQAADDPEIKALHRKLRIQKDRLVSWGVEWSSSKQSAEIDESLTEAGLTDLVTSIMGTIKDILAEAEPLWLASKRSSATERASEKAALGDKKTPLIVWDKGRFEDLVKDLTASIDTLCDLSRTRSSGTLSTSTKPKMSRPQPSMEDLRPYGSSRIQTPRQIDPRILSPLHSMQQYSSQGRPQAIFFMGRQDYSELTGRRPVADMSPLLIEYAPFDTIYSATGIMPEMSRFEKLSAGLQTESSRSPGAWIGLPLLLGYFEDMENSRLALVYSFPPTFKPVDMTQTLSDNLCTLADLLNRPNFEPTLEAKFRLAYNLANTVFDMHSRGITHGNLRTSAISFASTANNDSALTFDVDIRRPLISSFDIFPEPSSSPSAHPSFLLHRHPLDPRTTSQSPLAANSESKTLDLYSLAMMLVCIGLWTTLENLVPSQDSPSIPESVLHQLSIRCGTLYMRTVQACWNAIEHELVQSGTGDDTIVRQVQTRVSGYLEACCILDGVSGLDDRLSDEHVHSSSSRSSEKHDIPRASTSGPTIVTSMHTMYEEKPLALQDRSFSAPGPYSSDIKINPDIKVNPEKKTSDITSEKPKEKQAKQRLYPHVPLPAEIVDQWNEIIMPQINLALRHFYRKHPESVEISLESIGESPQKTTPTVLVVCTSVSKVRAILTKKLGILFDGTTTGISLKVCRGSVLRSRKSPTRSMAKSQSLRSVSQHSLQEANEDDDTPAANPDYQKRPHNGASIGAWIGDKHLPPVSLGGILLVDDKPYGMTVHHMLDDPDRPFQAGGDDEPPSPEATRASAPILRSSAASRDIPFLSEEESSSVGSEDDYACEFSDTESEYSATDLTSDDEEEEEDDEYEQFDEAGDIPGIEPGCGDGYIITQPALDDVPEGFYPSSDTENEDHLDTCSVGEIYASSGIRRRTEHGLVHEIDWALFEFENHRLPDEQNLFPQISDEDLPGGVQPIQVVPAKSLPGLDVQCMARTSGSQTGRILPALTTVKLYGRESPSHSYQVSGKIPGLPATPISHPAQARRGVSLGIPGDSGAWIIDRAHGRLCGHVLAWSGRKQVAYICPMEVLLLDIAETLEATDIRLPGGDVVVSMGGHEIEKSSKLQDSWAADIRESEIDDVVNFEDAALDQPSARLTGPYNPSIDILAREMDKVHFQDESERCGTK
ncbi:hypothetical protein F5Y16DRAFT_402797 [Xylariaceae sp. FL0255]|nr:hypothetical protein F5Y16DRAFT_402797 [Xylariaceae sp. FL0255]